MNTPHKETTQNQVKKRHLLSTDHNLTFRLLQLPVSTEKYAPVLDMGQIDQGSRQNMRLTQGFKGNIRSAFYL
jgi:hypothetical protein